MFPSPLTFVSSPHFPRLISSRRSPHASPHRYSQAVLLDSKQARRSRCLNSIKSDINLHVTNQNLHTPQLICADLPSSAYTLALSRWLLSLSGPGGLALEHDRNKIVKLPFRRLLKCGLIIKLCFSQADNVHLDKICCCCIQEACEFSKNRRFQMTSLLKAIGLVLN